MTITPYTQIKKTTNRRNKTKQETQKTQTKNKRT